MHGAVALFAGLSCCIAAKPAPPPAATATFVRVNQVGYPASAAKRAYVMSTAAQAGMAFSVKSSSGAVVYTGTVGASLGSWSTTYKFVQPADFDALTTTGTYTISVGSANSPPFRIDTGQNLYATPIANGLSFYQTERDGPNYIPNALRTAPGHLNDQNAMTYAAPTYRKNDVLASDLTPLGPRINAAGGWWDAGDYLKFVHTTTYTDAVLLMGVRDFPAQMGARAGQADFDAEAQFGARWLLRMWDDRTRTLYYQVGIGNGNDSIVSDHDIWRLPQDDDTYGGHDPAYRYIRHRPVFRAGPPGSPVSPNLAGRDAAALALCYQVYRTTDRGLARNCLVSAEHIFDLADTTPTGHLTTAIPFDFYPESEWRDDMELGAAELALALEQRGAPRGVPHRDSRHYVELAAHWAHAYIHGPNDAADTLNLYDVSALGHAELIRAMRGATHRLAVTRTALLADLRRQLARGIDQGRTDPFGFGYGWAQYDTTTHGTGLAVTASLYDQLTHSHRYAAVGMRWLGNVLGANAWGSSFILGDGQVFPHCTQHQVANIVGSLDGTAPVLAGAAVEGPNSEATTGRLPHMRACPSGGGDAFARFNSSAVYRDNVESYSTVEPAIDLTATSPLAFARVAAGID
jgi:endoglucanase